MDTSTKSATRTTTDRRTVIGVFDGPSHAEMALNALKDAGFSPDQVSVVARDSRESRDVVESTGMGAEGAATGALLGGITGGVLGWLVGIGALVIPGIGPIVAAGALATTLGGAAIGAAAGGLIGALVDMGVPEEDARSYEESVRQGSILLTVHVNSDEQARRARSIFDQHGGSTVRAYGLADDDTPGSRRRDSDTHGDEMAAAGGGAAGAVAGGVIGGVVGGPVGAGVGAAIGGAGGALGGHAAGEAAEKDESTSGAGAGVGGGAGAVAGGIIGSAAGPVGTAAGAAIGGAVGAGAGSKAEDVAADATDDDDTVADKRGTRPRVTDGTDVDEGRPSEAIDTPRDDRDTRPSAY